MVFFFFGIVALYLSPSGRWKGESSASVLVRELAMNIEWLLTFVYGPNINKSRDGFWEELEDI